MTFDTHRLWGLALIISLLEFSELSHLFVGGDGVWCSSSASKVLGAQSKTSIEVSNDSWNQSCIALGTKVLSLVMSCCGCRSAGKVNPRKRWTMPPITSLSRIGPYSFVGFVACHSTCAQFLDQLSFVLGSTNYDHPYRQQKTNGSIETHKPWKG